MRRQQLQKLSIPDKSGVYIFVDSRKRPLYIGRATSLRDRVKSYFAADLIETRGPRIVDMVTKASTIRWETTDSVLEAILEESALIKRYQPFYNIDERDDKSSLHVVITDEDWPRVFTMRGRDLEKMGIGAQGDKKPPVKFRSIFGPFPQGLLINTALRILRRIFPFRDRKAIDPRHERFYTAIGRSPEKNTDDDRRRYLDTIYDLELFMGGKKKALIKKLEKDMKSAIKEQAFERAGEIKRMHTALKHINDVALIRREITGDILNAGAGSKNSGGFRMEAYDIAHTAGRDVVGTMVVSIDGVFAKDQYRMFKLAKDRNDDVANLAEVISRRLNHSEWAYPDLIIVDGGENQLKAASAVLSARRIDIPVVSVVKDDRHNAKGVLSHDLGRFNAETISKIRAEIIALNAESHRFSIAYHRRRRGKSFGV